MNKAFWGIVLFPIFLYSCSEDNPEKPSTPSAPGFCKVEILEYNPAPGQFVNELPEYKEGMDYSQMLASVNNSISSGELVSLGGWGGTIVYHLIDYIENKPGNDFRIVGNAYYTRIIDGIQYGSSEPGIVYVMEDTNSNGLPDDIWYELKGSVSDEARFAEIEYIKNDSEESYEIIIKENESEVGRWGFNEEYHVHSYFPMWIKKESLKFSGKMLPENAVRLENGQYSQICYEGYADCQPNNSDKSGLDISSAVDENGNFVNLKKIDFIKVQTGVLQFNGAIGECSTEVGRIQVL